MESISNSNNSKKEDRGKTVERLESTYKGQYGEYKYYAGQVFVFKKENIANKTLLISNKPIDYHNRPYLKFRAKPVHTGDTNQELEETIKDWEEEWNWFDKTFRDISRLVIPKEKYSICEDPMGTNNNTVLISTKWVDGVQGDIFRMKTEKLFKYLVEYPQFRETLVELIKRFLELAKKDIYPDYIGTDNVAIYLKDNIPNISLIDPHIVWIGQYCNDTVKGRLGRAISRFEKFLEDPLSIENVKYLTSGGLMD